MESSLELQPLIETLNNAQIFVKSRSHFSPVLQTTSRALLRLSQFLGRPLRLAVLGESNAGKTTITNLIAGGIALPVLPVANTRLPTLLRYAPVPRIEALCEIPKELFLAEEEKALQSLPDNPFTFFNRGLRTVSANCHIHFENNYYSVPSHLIGKEVTVRWDERILRIIHVGEQVALHQKATGVGQYITRRSHLPDYKIYSETEYQKRAEEQMADIGEEAHEYFRFLLEKKESYWFRSVRIILGMAKEYGKEAVNLTLKRARYYQVRDLSTIKNILEKKLYLVTEEPRLLHKQETTGVQEEMFRDLSYYTTERSMG